MAGIRALFYYLPLALPIYIKTGAIERKARKPKPKGHYMDIISQPSQDIKPNLEPSTLRAMQRVENNYKEFVLENLKPPCPNHWLKNLTINVIEAFLRWYLDCHNVGSLPGFLVLVRFWRIYYCYELDMDFPYRLKRKTKELICTVLKFDYGLCEMAKLQPPINPDDLFALLYHAVAISQVYFPTQRQRTQHGTIRKMMTGTSARPGTLLESSGYCRTNDSLLWGDIELFMVMDPEHPTCQVLLMRVKHRLNKRKRNKGVPPIYSYTERNDNLGYCVIQDILDFAFEDDAFASEYIKEPWDIWRHTKVPEHRKSVPIHIKKEMWRILVFRPGVQNEEGKWITHPTRALTAKQFGEDENNLSRATGMEKVENLTEHQHNHVMGHTKGEIFRAYVNPYAGDTQSIYLGTPTSEALNKLSTHASLTRDPAAPQCLTKEQKEAVENYPELIQAKQEHHNCKQQLVLWYGKIQKAAGTLEAQEYVKINWLVRATHKKLQKCAFEQVYDEYFQSIGNTIIKQNYCRQPIRFETCWRIGSSHWSFILNSIISMSPKTC
ncbi:hypothetical protein CIHG_05843 [Coccidioides immitis H538.4]|uniref:FluG domain-containing protein n=2 Tax=Coccidioides immitis TaxID=5501 RepID=A0A0J8RS70_COCIT|nr:hypothetical protein CIHG_05843 [Coccidioides immitis H538.4]